MTQILIQSCKYGANSLDYTLERYKDSSFKAREGNKSHGQENYTIGAAFVGGVRFRSDP